MMESMLDLSDSPNKQLFQSTPTPTPSEDNPSPGVPVPFDIGRKFLCICPQDNKYHDCEIIERREIGSTGAYEYYIHFPELNRRLDRWVSPSELKPPDPTMKYTLGPMTDSQRRVTRREKRKLEDDDGLNEHEDGEQRLEDAIDKELEEQTKVKNVESVQLGPYEIDTWYYSPFPDEYSNIKKLYICEYCLKYMKKLKTLEQHKKTCMIRHPPGNEIYRDKNISVFEVDGAKHRVYCQCLCLLAKLFIDHKTLYYDVEHFRFYILTEVDRMGCHVVGYFSKEKVSDNNLACIVTFPHFQRKGYGNFLISLSYELSKIEKKVGGPEKPLSDLGKLSYRSYWTRVLLEVLSVEDRKTMSIQELSRITCIRKEDIISTLQFLGLVRYCKGEHILSVTPKLLEQHQQHLKVASSLALHVVKLRWLPPPPQAEKPTRKKTS